MKFGMRTPNLKKRVSARTTGKLKRTVKSSINPVYVKRGMGLINDPKKSVYNKVYNQTTYSIDDLIKQQKNETSEVDGCFLGCIGFIVLITIAFFTFIFNLF